MTLGELEENPPPFQVYDYAAYVMKKVWILTCRHE